MGVEHIERGRVAWVDTDAGGRIHFTAAFRWAEVAETGLLRSLELLPRWTDYPRRHVQADFLRVLVFEDEIETRLRVQQVGRTSVTYAWEIVKDGEPCVVGSHTAVLVDGKGRPEPIPDDVRSALEAAT